jgi:hypothetical protein
MLASRHSQSGLLVAILLLGPQRFVQAGITSLAVYGDRLPMNTNTRLTVMPETGLRSWQWIEA